VPERSKGKLMLHSFEGGEGATLPSYIHGGIF